MKTKQPIKLDLTFGDTIPDGFYRPTGFNPEKLPWKVPLGSGVITLLNESVEEAMCAYRFNRIPGAKRMEWMAELWRVLTPNGKCTMIVPYWASPRSIQDPFSAWPPLSEQSFLYFNKSFREANKIELNGTGPVDFDFTYGYTLDPETAGRADDTRPFWIKHYMNAVQDLQLILTKRPKL